MKQRIFLFATEAPALHPAAKPRFASSLTTRSAALAAFGRGFDPFEIRMISEPFANFLIDRRHLTVSSSGTASRTMKLTSFKVRSSSDVPLVAAGFIGAGGFGDAVFSWTGSGAA